MKKLLISTGGTGGHVIPGKIIGEHLKDKFQIFYATDKRGLKYLPSNINKIIIIDTPKLNLNIYFPIKLILLIYLIFKTIFYLKKEKIEKVISTGGYMSFPIIIGAKILNLPIFLLEPNLVLGRGNNFFLHFAHKIFCYSSKLSKFPKKYFHKIELIPPLISNSFYNLKKDNFKNDKFCFLISGGSQGAKIFDELIKDVMIDISKDYPIKIVQQTSNNNIENLKDFYNSKNIENKIFNYEEKFFNLINMSDLCITRAGANSLAEISFLNKPFIAIPLPSATDDHQMKNAKFYEEMQCCWILDQRFLNKERLFNMISDILKNKSVLNTKRSNLEKFNYENSWNNINQKLQKIIYEN